MFDWEKTKKFKPSFEQNDSEADQIVESEDTPYDIADTEEPSDFQIQELEFDNTPVKAGSYMMQEIVQKVEQETISKEELVMRSLGKAELRRLIGQLQDVAFEMQELAAMGKALMARINHKLKKKG